MPQACWTCGKTHEEGARCPFKRELQTSLDYNIGDEDAAATQPAEAPGAGNALAERTGLADAQEARDAGVAPPPPLPPPRPSPAAVQRRPLTANADMARISTMLNKQLNLASVGRTAAWHALHDLQKVSAIRSAGLMAALALLLWAYDRPLLVTCVAVAAGAFALRHPAPLKFLLRAPASAVTSDSTALRATGRALLLVSALPTALEIAGLCALLTAADRVASWPLLLSATASTVLYVALALAGYSAIGVQALGKDKFRALKIVWYVLLVAFALHDSARWDGRIFRQGLCSALFAAASARLSAVPPEVVASSTRYGLVVTLEDALMRLTREVSEDTMLQLAMLRWLVDFWNQEEEFSWTELRVMLVQSLEAVRSELLDQRLQPAIDALRRRLDDMDIDSEARPMVERTKATIAAISPPESASTALLAFKACPCAATLVVVLCGAVATASAPPGMALALLPCLAVEAIRLHLLAREVVLNRQRQQQRRRQATPASQARQQQQQAHAGQPAASTAFARSQEPPQGSQSSSAPPFLDGDGLSLLLRTAVPPLARVWDNILRCSDRLEDGLTVMRLYQTSTRTVQLVHHFAALHEVAQAMRDQGWAYSAMWLVKEGVGLARQHRSGGGLAAVYGGGDQSNSSNNNQQLVAAEPTLIGAVLRDAGFVTRNLSAIATEYRVVPYVQSLASGTAAVVGSAAGSAASGVRSAASAAGGAVYSATAAVGGAMYSAVAWVPFPRRASATVVEEAAADAAAAAAAAAPAIAAAAAAAASDDQGAVNVSEAPAGLLVEELATEGEAAAALVARAAAAGGSVSDAELRSGGAQLERRRSHGGSVVLMAASPAADGGFSEAFAPQQRQEHGAPVTAAVASSLPQAELVLVAHGETHDGGQVTAVAAAFDAVGRQDEPRPALPENGSISGSQQRPVQAPEAAAAAGASAVASSGARLERAVAEGLCSAEEASRLAALEPAVLERQLEILEAAMDEGNGNFADGGGAIETIVTTVDDGEGSISLDGETVGTKSTMAWGLGAATLAIGAAFALRGAPARRSRNPAV